MDYKEFYTYLYKKLNKRTPQLFDCGSLCGNICCKDDEDDKMGMYLFPHEEEMLKDIDTFSFEDSDFEYDGKKCKIVYCKPFCERKFRPLSCRIFPLFPYITTSGDLKVIVDPRARGICPLYKLEITEFSSKFRRGVKHVGIELMKNLETCEFLFELSRLIDDEVESILKLI